MPANDLAASRQFETLGGPFVRLQLRFCRALSQSSSKGLKDGGLKDSRIESQDAALHNP
jgi:hypothetical protein